jgi:hypothetical protein
MAILFILVADENASENLATWLDGFSRAYFLLKDEGVDLTLASVVGGWPWPGLERRSSGLTQGLSRFAGDAAAREELADTLTLDQVCVEDFEGAYCVGLQGPIRSDTKAADVKTVLMRFLSLGKPVALFPSIFTSTKLDVGNGLIITGETVLSARLAAHTLLAGVRARATDRDGET